MPAADLIRDAGNTGGYGRYVPNAEVLPAGGQIHAAHAGRYAL